MNTIPAPVLVCFCDRTACKRLLTVGAKLANEQHRPLSLLFIQPQELVSPTVAKDIQTVYDIASRERTEITVLFSDEPLLSLAVHARQIKAKQIVLDEHGFINQHATAVLHRLLPDLPITILEKGGKAVTFPPAEITVQSHRPHPTPVP